MAESPALGPTLAAAVSDAGDERLAAGTAAGEYVVERFVGAGAMGEVYAGHHPALGKKVAIKVLRRELAASAEAVERFMREARAVNQVEHANVVDVFAHGRLADGRLYLVMSFVAGTTLRARLADGALSIADALALLSPIADALDAAHARGVVHRDLKPDNIMVADGGRVVVLDFGIARLARPGQDPSAPSGPGTLTGRGTWLGTPAYMAPEMWSSDGASPASDRYALGVIAYELLAGAHPFAAASVPAMMEQHFRAAVRPLAPRVPAAADDVLARALAKDPDARWPSAHALVEALAAAAGTGVQRAAGSLEPSAGRRRTWVAPVLGAGVLVLAVGAVLATRGSTEPRDAPGATAAASDPPPGTIALEVTSTPDHALVAVGDRIVGPTPIAVHVAPGASFELHVTKPGYLADRYHVANAAATGAPIAIQLAAVTRFEGVWRLPDGELRAFERTGDEVTVSKLDTVSGPRRFFRRYAFVEAPAATVAFAADDEVIDPRAPDDPACHQPVHVEYRYDAATDALELERPTVDVDFVAGHCVARARSVQRERLVRVDQRTNAPDHLPAPAGIVKQSAPPKAKPRPRSVKQITTPNLDVPSKVNGQLLPSPQQGYPVQQPGAPAS